MDKQQIIRKLLDMGIQVDDGGLQLLMKEPHLLNIVLNTTPTPKNVNEEFLKKLERKDPVIIKSSIVENQIKIEDLHDHLKKRYEILKEIISENKELSNLISINRINEKMKEFSIIGIVSEINDNLILEDSTGSQTFEVRKKETTLIEGEVIGVICDMNDGKILVTKIIHPDIPIKRTVNKSDKEDSIVFTYDFEELPDSIKSKNPKVLLIGESFAHDEKNHKYTNPVYLEINNLKIFLTDSKFLDNYKEKWNLTIENTITNLLRKRHLNPSSNKIIDDVYFLDIIPDVIVFSNCKDTINVNYKGTTILTMGEKSINHVSWMLNTKTRETFKIDSS